jgi:hypothetical protein
MPFRISFLINAHFSFRMRATRSNPVHRLHQQNQQIVIDAKCFSPRPVYHRTGTEENIALPFFPIAPKI